MVLEVPSVIGTAVLVVENRIISEEYEAAVEQYRASGTVLLTIHEGDLGDYVNRLITKASDHAYRSGVAEGVAKERKRRLRDRISERIKNLVWRREP